MPFWKSWARGFGVLACAIMLSAATPAPQDRYAEVNGIRLHYVEQGEGPLILFLHGFPEFWYSWKDLLADFGRDHHAVALDMRGYNLSARPESVDAYRVPAIVEDVRALAVELKAKKFVLVGHDWGGVIAWAFAVQHPEMLEKLVIINAPHPTVFARELANNPAQQKASGYFNLFNSPQAEQVLSANNYEVMLQAFRVGSECGGSQAVSGSLEPARRFDGWLELLSRRAIAIAHGSLIRSTGPAVRYSAACAHHHAHAGNLGRARYRAAHR
jgi:pimeloyl-ACP methyl ester carboxylesterase